MAEKKQKKIVSAASGKAVTVNVAKDAGSSIGYRIGAIILWVVAVAFEVLAVFSLGENEKILILPQIWQIIVLLVLDLICVIIGSQLWKKANHIKPASEKNKVLFWLWNNMGVIVCAIAFIPFVIIALTNKETDKKTKTIAVVVAIIACLIGGVASYDWNPISQEEKDAQIENYTGMVYWSPYGRKYHTSVDCSHLNNSEELTEGTVQQAIENGRVEICKTCAARMISENGELADKTNDVPEIIDTNPTDENQSEETNE